MGLIHKYLKFSLFSLIGVSVLYANSEYPILMNSGVDPYLMVVKDETSNSQREPGIYGRARDGSWHQIARGAPVGGRKTGGVIAALNLTDMDDRNQAAVVMDGRLNIFHLYSNLKNPKSVLVLGSQEFPVRDFFFPTRVIQLPLLSSSDQLSFFEGTIDEARRVQPVLVSIKLDQLMLDGGDGLTILFQIKAAANPKQEEIELASDAMLVDNHYYTHEQLRELVISERNMDGMFTRPILEKYSVVHTSDPLPLRKWKQDVVGGVLKQLEAGRRVDRSMLPQIPYLDFKTRRVVVQKLPQMFVQLTQSLQLNQVYDPVGHQQGVYFGQGRDRVLPEEFTFLGVVDEDPNGEFYIFSNKEIDIRTQAAFVSINGNLYFLIQSNKVPLAYIQIGEKLPKVPDQLSYHVMTLPEKEGKLLHHVLLSTEDQGQAQTFFLLIEQNLGVLQIVRHALISRTFFDTDELRFRTQFHHEDKVVFDLLTPRQDSNEAYNQIYDPTVPHINLTGTTNQKLAQIYLQFLDEKEIIQGALDYRTYNEEHAWEKSTGLYFTDPKAPATELIAGELLEFDSRRQKSSALFSDIVEIPNVGRMRFSVVALDTSFEGGEKSFSLVFAMAPEEGAFPQHESFPRKRESGFSPKYLKFNMRSPFSDLQAVELFQGRKKHGHQLGFLVSVASQGIFVFSFLVEANKGELELHTQLTGHRLASEAGAEFFTRISLDDMGRIYWMDTPQLKSTDPHYKLTRIFDGQSLLLQSPEGRRTPVVQLTEVKDKDERFSQHMTHVNWRLWSPGQIRDMILEFEKQEKASLLSTLASSQKPAESLDAAEEKQKDLSKIQIGKDVHRRLDEYYPRLAPILHQLADPSVPGQHQVVLIPEFQKDHFIGYVLKLWAEEDFRNRDGLPPQFRWSSTNDRLKLFMMNLEKSGQEDFFHNLSSMFEQSQGRSVLLVDLDKLAQIDRPIFREEGQEDPFVLDLADVGATGEEFPHGVYLLETEGAKVPLKDFKVHTQNPKKTSILFFGSKEALQRVRDQAKPEMKAGLFEKSPPPISYHHGEWRVWGPNTVRVDPVIQNVLTKGVAKYRQNVFPELEKLLQDVSVPSQPSRHRVLIVPAEIKDFVKNTMLSRWADPQYKDQEWHFSNSNLRLYRLKDDTQKDASKKQPVGQESIFENLEIMRTLPEGEMAVLLGDLSRVKTVGRPKALHATSREFYLKDVAQNTGESMLEVEPSQPSSQTFPPHLLYLLATEGQAVSLEDFEAWKKTHPSHVSTVLVGTRAEWNHLIQETALEERFGLSSHFEILELKLPDHETRKNMLRQILSRPEIRSLGYQFDSRVPGSTTPKDPLKMKDEILAYMVSFCERLSKERNKDILTEFLKFFQVFQRALIEDPLLRRDKKIDRFFVQRLMSKVFTRVQLNPTLLPPSDPVNLLSSREDLAMRVEQAGYKGPFDMTTRVARVLLNQTDPNPKLSIPSSFIMIGETGSGKTSLILALLKVLDIQLYDFNKPGDLQAQAFVLDCRQLVEESDNISEGQISITEARAHFEHFMTLPNANRSFIFFDDAHLPKDSVKEELVQWMETLMNSQDGMWRGKSPFTNNAEPVEVPLHNTMFGISLNPIYDRERLERFVKEWERPTTDQMIFAALSTKGKQLGPEFVRRVAEVFRLDEFAQGAKSAALLADAKKGAQNIFNTQNRIVVISPDSAELISSKFPDANARTFLSEAPRALLNRADGSDGNVLQIVVPRVEPAKIEDQSLKYWGGDPVKMGNQQIESAIEQFIQESTHAIPIEGSFEGRLEFVKYLVSGFRVYVYECLIKAMWKDPKFSLSEALQSQLLAPLLHGVKHHLTLNPGLLLEHLNLDSKDFGASNRSLELEFKRALEARDKAPSAFRPRWIFRASRNQNILSLIEGGLRQQRIERSRRDVMNDTAIRLEQKLRAFLTRVVAMEQLERLPSAKAWLQSLGTVSDVETDKVLQRFSTEIVRDFLDFSGKLFADSLLEMNASDRYAVITTYDMGRLFYLALDRAIEKLPWGQLTQFMIGALSLSAREMSLGELPSAQAYFFEKESSILMPRTPELPVQMAESSMAYRAWREAKPGEVSEKEERFGKNFLDQCERMFERPKGIE